MLAIAEALKLWKVVEDADRVKHTTDLLRDHVLPCFELYRTHDAVRQMAGNYAAPLRAQGFAAVPMNGYPTTGAEPIGRNDATPSPVRACRQST